MNTNDSVEQMKQMNLQGMADYSASQLSLLTEQFSEYSHVKSFIFCNR
jgi:hypothetical protein